LRLNNRQVQKSVQARTEHLNQLAFQWQAHCHQILRRIAHPLTKKSDQCLNDQMNYLRLSPIKFTTFDSGRFRNDSIIRLQTDRTRLMEERLLVPHHLWQVLHLLLLGGQGRLRCPQQSQWFLD